MSDSEVRRITAAAVTAARDQAHSAQAARRARQALLDLPGAKTGDPFASAVILAAAPDRMAVYDYRAHLGLWLVGLRLADGSASTTAIDLLSSSAGQSWQRMGTELDAREVDLALFTDRTAQGPPRPRPWK